MEPEIAENVELISLHSPSKGFVAEAGLKGGFFDIENMNEDVIDEFIKTQTIRLGSNSIGQIMTALMTNPPNLEMESKETVDEYNAEVRVVMDSLKKRAVIANETFNSMKNVTCKEIAAGYNAFPRLQLSQKFCDEAREQNVSPDYLYCSKVLENTGVVLVPGDGFLQKEGTYHFRCSILPLPYKRFNEALGRLK